jgi:glucan 1,3-beta-glucosidase
MTPSIFNATDTADEWHLCNALGKQECLSTLNDHWSTFYTRSDFLAMKAAGLNSVRIPLGYWAVDLLDYEPYVSGQYPYLVQAVQWAKEMGFTVMVDIHGAPGSQNGWEETGLVGPIEFIANQSNTDRTLNVLKNLTTEFTKDVYGGVVTNIELMNEPIFADAALRTFYTAGANVVGAANSSGINITIHGKCPRRTYVLVDIG